MIETREQLISFLHKIETYVHGLHLGKELKLNVVSLRYTAVGLQVTFIYEWISLRVALASLRGITERGIGFKKREFLFTERAGR
jgi:hypothetical protein